MDLPIVSMVIFHSYVSLPEGTNGNADFVDGFLKILLMEMLIFQHHNNHNGLVRILHDSTDGAFFCQHQR